MVDKDKQACYNKQRLETMMSEMAALSPFCLCKGTSESEILAFPFAAVRKPKKTAERVSYGFDLGRGF